MKTLFFFIFIFLNLSIYSQSKLFSNINIFTGIITPHRIGMESLSQKNVKGFELNFYYKTGKNSPFNSFYNFPKIGTGINYNNLGNPDALGNAGAIFLFMDFNLKSFNRFSFNSKIAMGLAYVEKTYDKILNPENVAVSTNINFYLNWNFNIKYKTLNSRLIYNLDLGLMHYSNGAVIKPNKGLNQILISGGIAYNISNIKIENNNNIDKNFKKHEFWSLATISTADEYAYGDTGRGGGFFCSTFAIGYNKRYSHTGKYGIALDFFYNENFYYYYDKNYDTLINIYNKPIDIIRSGISLGHEFIYHKLSFISYAGVYYYNKVKPSEWIYTRIGLKYYPINNIFINLSLKAYGFKAYYIESGIGFSLYK